MDPSSLRALIDQVASGECTPDDAVRQLRRLPYADLGFARIDHHRDLRQGMPEAVYGPGKAPEHCAAIVEELLGATTGPGAADPGHRCPGQGRFGAQTEALGYGTGRGHGDRLDVDHDLPTRPRPGGARRGRDGGDGGSPRRRTSARRCCGRSASRPTSWSTAGWPGLHRLLAEVDELAMADAVVVIAGMEGALASVVGGLTPAPVVAVPTSTGYGAAFEGLTALLAMLAACASGVTVVGIDNGYGAACAIARLLP